MGAACYRLLLNIWQRCLAGHLVETNERLASYVQVLQSQRCNQPRLCGVSVPQEEVAWASKVGCVRLGPTASAGADSGPGPSSKGRRVDRRRGACWRKCTLMLAVKMPAKKQRRDNVLLRQRVTQWRSILPGPASSSWPLLFLLVRMAPVDCSWLWFCLAGRAARAKRQ